MLGVSHRLVINSWLLLLIFGKLPIKLFMGIFWLNADLLSTERKNLLARSIFYLWFSLISKNERSINLVSSRLAIKFFICLYWVCKPWLIKLRSLKLNFWRQLLRFSLIYFFRLFQMVLVFSLRLFWMFLLNIIFTSVLCLMNLRFILRLSTVNISHNIWWQMLR